MREKMIPDFQMETRPAAATTEPQWRAGRFSRQNGRLVQCTLCPHLCALEEGEVGQCGTRRRRGEIIETATYAASVRHLDCIEKKPFYHFRPGTKVLTVAAPGCSFSCHYCQNYRLSQVGHVKHLAWTALPVEPEDLVREAKANGAAIGFSYSEPSLAAELTLDVAALGRRDGVDVVWKTNGFMTAETLERMAPSLSAVNIDIKAANDVSHRRLTGAARGPVIEALRYFVQTGTWVEVSTPVIPGVNADPASLRSIAETIAEIGVDIPWHLGRFNPDFRMNAARPTLPGELDRAKQIADAAGLLYVYVERATGGSRNTTCPRCHALIVERAIWRTVRVLIESGKCSRCGFQISGRW
jgi:pyruvate formate lyase activating enzyme